MKTTQEKADQLRVMLDMPKFLQSIDPRDVYRLLDDRDELARLREGLKEALEASDRPLRPEIERLLLNNGDDDG